MAAPQSPLPVKLIMAVLYSDEMRLAEARTRSIDRFGPIDFTSAPFPFEVTDYYVPEMGAPIIRCFYAFERLISPGNLAGIKLVTNVIEEQLAVDGQRKVNLDPGYLDPDKFVLASAKYNGQKIYLSDGIWADLTLHYEKGHFYAYPWSFPDFRSGEYEKAFLRMREIYKAQLKRSERRN
ncbi:MAG: DUF4416 family protein [candidate division KSB1 bacterium]|nr:DUF4416 family protein [candidate division KSB1 bacterium]MDZ7300507.1 DUF4416 family protein [candidate division KSB1 bacterium]MDZ7309646.1 DUF4416 family protein [candidate division KSB1 bacterium]